jgi:hypothetical protein
MNFFLAGILDNSFTAKSEPLALDRMRPDSPLINSNTNFDTGKRYARLLTSLTIHLVFCGPIPLLSLLGCISIGLQYLTDKFMLIHYHSYDARQGIRLQIRYLQLA